MKMHFENSIKPADVSDQDWNSWQWQMRNSLRTQEDFSKWFALTEAEVAAFKGGDIFNIRTTPYYASLVGNSGSSSGNDALRLMMVPTSAELQMGSQAQLDPLGEKKNNPTSRIIHRYPDRVLFLVTDTCSVYCRYCTRKHFTGQEQAFIKEAEYQKALEYIKTHEGVREVILSGGDPLTLSDQQIFRILKDLRAIEHIEIIRIGTRMPVVCPMRITHELVAGIRDFGPVFMMTHFNHPREVTAESRTALAHFIDHGIPVMNQMVLLNGVNNHPAIVQALSRRLLFLRVKPYYMFQCDPSRGTDHLRISIEESEQIQSALWGNISGLAMPSLSLDIPSGGGKVGIVPNFEIARSVGERTYRGFDGVVEKYVNPVADLRRDPVGMEEYIKEWEQLKNAKSTSSIS
jgi:lysine 2,3-aminomutase